MINPKLDLLRLFSYILKHQLLLDCLTFQLKTGFLWTRIVLEVKQKTKTRQTDHKSKCERAFPPVLPRTEMPHGLEAVTAGRQGRCGREPRGQHPSPSRGQHPPRRACSLSSVTPRPLRTQPSCTEASAYPPFSLPPFNPVADAANSSRASPAVPEARAESDVRREGTLRNESCASLGKSFSAF